MILSAVEAEKLPLYEAPPPRRRTAKILIDKETVGAENVALGIAFYEPGERADAHSHDGEETMYVLQGKAVLTTGKREYELKEGMAAYVPPNEQHMLENRGDITFSFVFVFTPPGSERAIRNTWKRLPQSNAGSN
jgi:quercetin dioxygenase-like cupin family protein